MTELPSGMIAARRRLKHMSIQMLILQIKRFVRQLMVAVEMTGNFGFASFGSSLYIDKGETVRQPEFGDGGHVQAVAKLIDNIEPWLREAAPDERVKCVYW